MDNETTRPMMEVSQTYPENARYEHGSTATTSPESDFLLSENPNASVNRIPRKPVASHSPLLHSLLLKPTPESKTPSRDGSHSSRFSLGHKYPNIKLGRPVEVHLSTPLSSSSSLSDVENQAHQEKEQLEVWKPGKAEWLVMITMSVASLVVAIDSTILVPVLPALAQDLHGSAQEAFWAGTSYLLTNAVFQPVLAGFSDIFGRREVVFPSVLAFLVGSIICGWAKDFATLLTGRVIQGVGGAGVIVLAQLIFADMVPLRQRPKYFALVLIAWGVGTILGPVIGGAFVQNTTWRWCFWLNIPICVVSLVMVVLFVTLTKPKTSLKEKLGRFDWVGSTVFISSLTSFLIAISWAGTRYAWSSWHTLVPLIVGILGLMATIAWEYYMAVEPILTRALFKHVSAIFCYLCTMFQGIAVFMLLYYIPFYFTAVRNTSPLTSGVNLLPACICLLPGSAVISGLITRLGHYRIFIWTGWIIATIGAGLLILLNETTSTAVWATGLCIFGVGIGMVLSSHNFAAQACVDPKDTGRAGAMYAFARNVGMSLGVAIGGTVFQNFMKRELTAQGLPTSIALNAEGYVHQLWDRTVTSQATFDRVLPAYVHGFQGVFEVTTAICGVALLLSLFIKHFNMDQMLESKFTIKR